MSSPSMDPRLLPSVTQAKAADVEARVTAHLESHPAAAPALVYGTTATTVTQSSNGSYTWTPPAGVTQAKIEVWGAGAGAGGGSAARGGEGGGGGEYACEPAYPLVPGQAYSYVVGNGGTGGTTGAGGQGGGNTVFDTGNAGGIAWLGGVFASGGNSGGGFTGGSGGGTGGTGNAPSLNAIVRPGAPGGGNGSQGTGGCGGGGAGGANAGGTGGSTSGSSSGAAGGSGGSGGGGTGGAGGNSGANGNGGGAPGAGGGGCGAATSASSGSSSYRLTNSATYYGSDASGGNANGFRSSVGGTMWQGGETASGGTYNGTQKSLGIVGGNPPSDLSGKTIDQVSIRLEWTHTWYNNGSYVILGYTGRSSTPLSWDGTGITGVKTWFQGSVGHPVTTDLTNQGLGGALQSGAAKSVCLGPGGAYNLNNYGSAYGAGGSNSENPLIVVNWHTGSSPVQAGAGADGQVKITYVVSSALTAALQPAAGSDDSGNAFAAGYTGPVVAVQPGSSPAVTETWHAITTDSGWSTVSGYSIPQYRLLPDGNLQLAGNAQRSTTVTASIALNASSPLLSAYRPNNTRLFRCFNAQGARGAVQIDSSGVITMLANSGAPSQFCEIDAVLKIN